MKISEIIPILQDALEKHGDLDIVYWNEEWEDHYYVDGAEAVEFAADGDDVFALVITSSDDTF